MEVIPIDLTKNPDVAALVADMQPGEKIYGCFTIKDKDDQTLSIRIKEMASTKDELSSKDEMDDEEESEDDADESPEGEEMEMDMQKPPETAARKLARQIESNSGEY